MSEDKVNFQTPTAFPHTISYQLETGKKKKKKITFKVVKTPQQQA